MSSSSMGSFLWLRRTQEGLVVSGWAEAVTEQKQEGRAYTARPGLYK